MEEHKPKIPALPGEDLGRGGEAAAGPQAGPAGEREELVRGRLERPDAGPAAPEPEPPTTSTK